MRAPTFVVANTPAVQREVDSKMERQPAEPSATSASAERFARLVMLSDEPMFAWRLSGSIDFWNTGAEGLYGFTSNEAVGRSSHALLQTVFPLDLSDLLSQLQRQRHWSGELRHMIDFQLAWFETERVLAFLSGDWDAADDAFARLDRWVERVGPHYMGDSCTHHPREDAGGPRRGRCPGPGGCGTRFRPAIG